MRRVLLAALFVAASGLAVSCMTSGQRIDPEHVAQLEQGKAMKEDVSGWFGYPVRIVKPLRGHPKGCVERWMFVYSESLGSSTKSQSLLVDFDKGGKICDYNYTRRGD